MKNILCFVAHPDDEIVGMGGTLINYSKGANIIVVIFTYGEKSDPLVREEVLQKKRVEESKKVGKYVGVRETIFLGLRDGSIRKSVKDEKFLEKIEDTINEYKPDKVFTHAAGDMHIAGDHIAVHKIIVKVLDSMKFKGDLYTFDVWSPLQILKRDKPKLYVDISKSFDKKLKALEMYESQKASVYSLLPGLHLKARVYGNDIKCRYAEMFYKLM